MSTPPFDATVEPDRPGAPFTVDDAEAGEVADGGDPEAPTPMPPFDALRADTLAVIGSSALAPLPRPGTLVLSDPAPNPPLRLKIACPPAASPKSIGFPDELLPTPPGLPRPLPSAPHTDCLACVMGKGMVVRGRENELYCCCCCCWKWCWLW